MPHPSPSEHPDAIQPQQRASLIMSRRRLLLGAAGLAVAATTGATRAVPVTGSPARSPAVWPPIVPRSGWDPERECVPRRQPDLADRVRGVVVHHTQIYAGHDPDTAPALLRQICRSHVGHRGFDDIAYHFIIAGDGAIYQGRQGRILDPIVGAHVQGLNVGTVGIALIGDFNDEVPSEPALHSLVRMIAFLAAAHGFDPLTTSAQTSTGGANARWPEGTTVTLPNVTPHRALATTGCPGDHLATLVRSGTVARRAAALL